MTTFDVQLAETEAPARPHLGRLRIGVLALTLAAALLGAGITWFALRPPAEGSAEVEFARDMSTHHAQAVELAQILRDRTANADLRQFTLDIVLTQQAQIGQMQGWLAAWQRPFAGLTAPMGGAGEAMGMATPEQVESLRTLPLAEAETTFLQLMVRHHQGGVHMAEDVLQRTRKPEVVRLATAIVGGQQSEIEYMTNLLSQRGVAPLPAPQPAGDHMNH